MPRLLMIDNYDSFAYNLFQYLGELGAEVEVVRNDDAPLDELLRRDPDGLVISPGPGRPEDAGCSEAALRRFAEAGTPVLGVCLGHQALGTVFGARLRRARRPMHGKTSGVHHDGRGVFRALPSPLRATRYHSLVVDESSCPESLTISARADDGAIMGLRHRALPVEGVQFHPESVLSDGGHALLGNFVTTCEERAA